MIQQEASSFIYVMKSTLVIREDRFIDYIYFRLYHDIFGIVKQGHICKGRSEDGTECFCIPLIYHKVLIMYPCKRVRQFYTETVLYKRVRQFCTG